MGLDFDNLCKPYAAGDMPDSPTRTPELQRAWLVERKGVREDVVDGAMAVVYSRLERGKTFENGDALDQYLLKECRKQQLAKHKALLRVNQTNANKLLATAKDRGGWGYIATWSGMAFVLGGLVAWLLIS